MLLLGIYLQASFQSALQRVTPQVAVALQADAGGKNHVEDQHIYHGAIVALWLCQCVTLYSHLPSPLWHHASIVEELFARAVGHRLRCAPLLNKYSRYPQPSSENFLCLDAYCWSRDCGDFVLIFYFATIAENNIKNSYSTIAVKIGVLYSSTKPSS